MNSASGIAGERIRLQGEAVRGVLSVDEIIRPFGIKDRGVTFVHGDVRNRISYAELADQVLLVAANLRRAGVAAAERIAIVLSNDLESALVMLGAWAAGCTVVSLPPAHGGSKGWYTDQFGPVLESMGCEFMVSTGDSDAASLPRCGARVLTRDKVLDLSAGVQPFLAAEVPRIALIQFTSGSLAAPKGVAISADALAVQIASIAQSSEVDGARDKLVSWLPLYHDLGLIAMFMQGLAARAEQVIMLPGEFIFKPARWLATIARERGTLTAAPNFAFRMAALAPYAAETDLSSVRAAIDAGERIDWDVLVQFHEAVGPLGLRWGAVSPCYGLAENVVGVTCTKAGRGPVRHGSGCVAVGSPMPGVLIEGPAGPSAGPIHIAGSSLFDGYYTADGFVSGPAGGWFDTGDAGFIEDGELYVLGRRAETVTAAGRNVFAEDIESVVRENGGSSIRACAAFRNKEYGLEFGVMIEVEPKALRSGADLAALATSVRAAVIDAVGVRPAKLSLVRVGTIPRTTSGKVKRAQSRELMSSASISRRTLFTLT